MKRKLIYPIMCGFALLLVGCKTSNVDGDAMTVSVGPLMGYCDSYRRCGIVFAGNRGVELDHRTGEVSRWHISQAEIGDLNQMRLKLQLKESLERPKPGNGGY